MKLFAEVALLYNLAIAAPLAIASTYCLTWKWLIIYCLLFVIGGGIRSYRTWMRHYQMLKLNDSKADNSGINT
jgi:hypothetical protein